MQSLEVELHWPIVRILHPRNDNVWQQRVEDELIVTPWPLRAMTDERIVLAVQMETVDDLKFQGELQVFEKNVLKEGLNFVLLKSVSDCDWNQAEAEFAVIQKNEKAFYARDRNSVPDWYVKLMRESLAQARLKFLEKFSGAAILQLILPKPTHPLILDSLPSTKTELDLCSQDLIQSRLQSTARKQHPSLFRDPIISNPSLRALHALKAQGFFASNDQIGPEGCQLLWAHRRFIAQRFPALLPMFIQSVQWWLAATDKEEIEEAFQLLAEWRMPRSKQKRIELAGQILLVWPNLSSDGPEWSELLNRLVPDAQSQAKLCRQWIKAVVKVLSERPESKLAEHLQGWLATVCDEDLDFACQFYWMSKDSITFTFSEVILREVEKQISLFEAIDDCLMAVEKRKVSRLQRIELLRKMLADPDGGIMLKAQQSVLLPGLQQGTDGRTCALVASNASLFKSTALAAFLPFLTGPGGASLPLIYKKGDDLRRDDAILRIFRVINEAWNQEAGLNLIPKELLYGVLPTGPQCGWVEFVPSKPISALLQNTTDEHKKEFALLHFLQSTPEPSTASDNFLLSCAGFSLLTFVFGVGDRHLDNLLITPTGHLLHIDFAFLFGSDPKPFAPPLKLSPEMIRALGEAPGGWERFKGVLLAAFSFLREKAGVLEALVRAEFPKEAGEAGKFVRERLMIGIGEVEALERVNSMIEEARSAMYPQVLDKIHQWAQYWKS